MAQSYYCVMLLQHEILFPVYTMTFDASYQTVQVLNKITKQNEKYTPKCVFGFALG
jgi:hypothetical protein